MLKFSRMFFKVVSLMLMSASLIFMALSLSDGELWLGFHFGLVAYVTAGLYPDDVDELGGNDYEQF